ncbi:MAG: helix-turn-helix domain-containing protein [Lachnospiraceae bacterium]|nr:helix-turn-helix domain-containing protein [Lachnospiraceae bacterium]
MKLKSDRLECGRLIRDFRLGRHMTQAQLAESLEVSTNFISEIETGKKGISHDTLCRLCKRYNLSADYILFGTAPEHRQTPPLYDALSTLSVEEIPVVIRYLEAMLKVKQLKCMQPD